MARLGLTGLPPHRPIETALTWLPGVSRSRAKAILQEAHIDPEITTESLTAAQLELVRQLLRDADGAVATETPWLAGAAVDFAP